MDKLRITWLALAALALMGGSIGCGDDADDGDDDDQMQDEDSGTPNRPDTGTNAGNDASTPMAGRGGPMRA